MPEHSLTEKQKTGECAIVYVLIFCFFVFSECYGQYLRSLRESILSGISDMGDIMIFAAAMPEKDYSEQGYIPVKLPGEPSIPCRYGSL